MSDHQASRRQVVLGCLDRPRRVADVAAAIDRPISNASGQIAALLKTGAVVKLRHGVYVRTELAAQYADAGAPSLPDLILDACSTEQSLTHLATVLARAPRRLRTILNRMVRQGLLEKVGRDGFRRPQPDLFV